MACAGRSRPETYSNSPRSCWRAESCPKRDADAFMLEMNRLFWDSKERAKKYTPRKYLKVDGSKDE